MNPTIHDAKALALKLRRRGVIILAFESGQYSAASYGMTRPDCDAMKDVLGQIADLIEEGVIELPDGFAAPVEDGRHDSCAD